MQPNGKMDGQRQVSKTFIVLCASALLLLGTLKLLGSFVPTEVDRTYVRLSNPIFPFLSNQTVFFVASLAEIATGWFCMLGRNVLLRSFGLLWFAIGALGYKVLLIFVNYSGPCGCLLGVNRLIPMSPKLQRTVADSMLATIFLVAAVIFVQSLRTTGSTVVRPPDPPAN